MGTANTVIRPGCLLSGMETLIKYLGTLVTGSGLTDCCQGLEMCVVRPLNVYSEGWTQGHLSSGLQRSISVRPRDGLSPFLPS